MTTQINTGNAQTVAQVDQISVTYATASGWSATINGKTVSTSTAADSTITSDYTAAVSLANALSASTAPAEFRQVTWAAPASSTSNLITATGATNDSGAIPFTLSVGHTGSGNTGHSTISAATGPNFWNNTANWSSGTLPTNNDAVVLTANSAAAIQYGIDQHTISLASMSGIGWSGQIGLPQENIGGYPEYNPTALSISFGALSFDGASSPTLVRLNAGTAAFSANIQNTGARAEAAYPAITIAGGAAGNALTVAQGDVGVAAFVSDTSTLTGGLIVGQPNNQGIPPTLTVGSGCAVLGTTTLSSGTATISSPNLANTLTQHGGTVTVNGTSGLATATIKGGTLLWNSTGTLASASLIPEAQGGTATLDLSTSQVARTITSLTLAASTTFNDPNHLATVNTIALASGTTWNEVTINNGAGRTYTPAS